MTSPALSKVQHFTRLTTVMILFMFIIFAIFSLFPSHIKKEGFWDYIHKHSEIFFGLFCLYCCTETMQLCMRVVVVQGVTTISWQTTDERYDFLSSSHQQKMGCVASPQTTYCSFHIVYKIR